MQVLEEIHNSELNEIFTISKVNEEIMEIYGYTPDISKAIYRKRFSNPLQALGVWERVKRGLLEKEIASVSFLMNTYFRRATQGHNRNQRKLWKKRAIVLHGKVSRLEREFRAIYGL